QTVELPYRVVNTAAGDLSSAAAKRYDIEAWFPSQSRYREITSCSNTTDYQARRSGIRYRTENGGLETPHTLNGTAATDRTALAVATPTSSATNPPSTLMLSASRAARIIALML